MVAILIAKRDNECCDRNTGHILVIKFIGFNIVLVGFKLLTENAGCKITVIYVRFSTSATQAFLATGPSITKESTWRIMPQTTITRCSCGEEFIIKILNFLLIFGFYSSTSN